MTIFMLRIRDVVLNPQFWSEDGKIFFRDNLCEGAGAIGKVYAGYIHLVPRLTALLSGAFPPLYAPAIYMVVALALTACVLYLVQSPRFPLPFAPLLALAVVLSPAGSETWGNITNIQWFMAIGTVTVALMRPSRSPVVMWSEVAFIVVAGLTGPFVLFLLPVFAGKLLLDWNDVPARRRMLALSVAALAVASVQAYALILNPVPTLFPPDVPRNSAAEIPLLAAAAVFLHTFGMLAREIVLAVSPGHPPGFAALGWLGFAEIGVLLAVVLGSIRSKRLRFERLALLYFGCIVLLAAIFKFRDGLVSLTLPFNGPRYFLIPAVVASWVILSAIPEPRVGTAAKFLLGLLLVSALVQFSHIPFVDYDWPSWAAKLEAGSLPRIPINPHSWFIETDCSLPQ
jgi:hypothetical protein